MKGLKLVSPNSSRTFRIGDHKGEHEVGNSNCKTGSCGITGGKGTGRYPARCICGGLVHCENIQAEDAVYESSVFPEKQCDQCDAPREVINVVGGVWHFLREACIRVKGMPKKMGTREMLIIYGDFCREEIIRELYLPPHSEWLDLEKALKEYKDEYPQHTPGVKSSGGLDLCRRLAAREHGLDLNSSWEEIERVAHQPEFITIQVGTFMSKKMLLDELKHRGIDLTWGWYGYLTNEILAGDEFRLERQKRQIELVILRRGSLISDKEERETKIKTYYESFVKRGLECGLEYCPPETAFQLSLQYTPRPDQYLTVVSTPFRTERGEVTFTVCRDKRENMGIAAELENTRSSLPDYESSAMVFVRPPGKEINLPKWEWK